MLIIGHRGAAGLAHENSLEAFEAGLSAKADILEFDVQRTRDGELLVAHDTTLFRTHSHATILKWSTYEGIKKATARGHKIATLSEVLDLYFGKVVLNLEIKNRGTAYYIVRYLEEHYIKQPSDWELILLSSFKVTELIAARRTNNDIELALLHKYNPYKFIMYHRRLNLTAVGFGKKHLSHFAFTVARKIGLFTYIYTINSLEQANEARHFGADAIVTDNPKTMREMLK